MTTEIRRGISLLINTVLCGFPLLAWPAASGQGAPRDTARASSYIIRAAHLVDGKTNTRRHDVAILVDGERIVAVGPLSEISTRATGATRTINLGAATLLPGL